LLPATDEAGAEETAQRMRVEIERSFDIEGRSLCVGVSIGIAVHQGGDQDANDVMRQADRAMYRAKRQRTDNGEPRA